MGCSKDGMVRRYMVRKKRTVVIVTGEITGIEGKSKWESVVLGSTTKENGG